MRTRFRKHVETQFDEQYFELVLGGYNFDTLLPLFNSLAELLVKLSKPSKALDIGCAKGFLCSCLKDYNVEAFGVDISRYALQSSPMQARGNLIMTDIERFHLPFKNDSFDLITMIETLPFLKNYAPILDDIERTLRKEGFCCITTPLSKSEIARDPFYVNIRGEKFWVKEFTSRNLRLMDDPTNNIFKHTLIKGLKSCGPTTRLGKTLVKLGKMGTVLRSLSISAIESQRLGVFLLRKNSDILFHNAPT